MGITGLIPFLNKSSKRVNIKEYAGQTVAIDAYCWLHKGAFSCAEKLVMNEPTLQYVAYCMKFINMLLSHNIKPILVFDGRHLPAKADTEEKRKMTRAMNCKKGAELLRAGKTEEGRNYLRRSLDITHEMALNLIKACRERNIDCIVAPYEADAQLAYLNIKGIAQLVITEDSDLLLFGCVKVLFKMDINGNGLLIERDKLHISMGMRHDKFSIDKFRYMCILSGCDYLASLPGIGLGKARKFINRTSETNIYEALLKLPVNLQMWTLEVSNNYRNAFVEADRTFKYQLVYDPIQRKQVPLTETEDNDFVGEKLDENIAFQLALGNLDPFTLKQMDSYNPDEKKITCGRTLTNSKSIWNADISTQDAQQQKTANNSKIISNITVPNKRPVEMVCDSGPGLSRDYLVNLYTNKTKKICRISETACEEDEKQDRKTEITKTLEKSPILFSKKNPFALKSSLSVPTKRKFMGALTSFKPELESDDLLSSRYFTDDRNENKKQESVQTSVLAIFQKEQTKSQEKVDNIQNSVEEHIGMEVPVIESEDLSSSKNDSSSEIKTALSRISIFDKKNGISALDDNLKNEVDKCSPEESKMYAKCEGNFTNRKSDHTSAQFSRDKTVLSILNRMANARENFYYVNKTDNLYKSPYFQTSQDKNYDTQAPSFKSPIRSIKKASLLRNTKKALREASLGRGQGKHQSLLTNFGFQQRPKMSSGM